jgi:hypothetical protein
MNSITITLLIILIIRALIQIVGAVVTNSNFLLTLIYLTVSTIYGISAYGVFRVKKWGVIMTMVIATIDILMASTLGGGSGFSATLIDLLLIAFGFLIYKNHHEKARTVCT